MLSAGSGRENYPAGVTSADLSFLDPIPDEYIPDPCCEYCNEYDGNHCMKRWNNLDKCYYNPDLDDKEPEDCCEDYDWNGETLEEPKKPKKEDFKDGKAYMKAVLKWKAEINKIHMEEMGL